MLSKRIQKVVESVLENEAIIGGLDKNSAEILQEWGIKNATLAVEKTATLDDALAEKEMYPTLKASRHFLRAIRVWIEHEKESSAEERTKLWDKVEKRAKEVYGEQISLPSANQFMGKTSAEFVNNLRNWLENGKVTKKKKGFFASLFN